MSISTAVIFILLGMIAHKEQKATGLWLLVAFAIIDAILNIAGRV